MKLKNVIVALSALVLLASSAKVFAQTDTGKYYAYAHLYSDDNYTEYISSVFCWTKNASITSPDYPSDSLTRWVKRVFKGMLPDVHVRQCVCKFTRSDGSFYTSADQATKSWNMEITESKGDNTTVQIVSFPDCVKK